MSLESFHLKYPVGKMETRDQLGRTWTDIIDPPQIPAFGHESINMLVDNVLLPILSGGKRWSFEQAAKASQPLLLIPFIAEALTPIKAKYAEETTAPGPTRAGQAAAEIGIDELANATSSAGPPLPAEIKTLEYFFERKKTDCCWNNNTCQCACTHGLPELATAGRLGIHRGSLPGSLFHILVQSCIQ